MAQAQWGSKVWQISRSGIRRLDGLKTGYAMQTETNADKDGESPTQEVGYELQSVSFSTSYNMTTGTQDVRREFESWKSLVGKANPLYIGGAKFGPDKLQLISVDLGDNYIDENGLMRWADVSFSFKEYAEEIQSISYSGDANSAVYVTATKADKASKKTLTIE
ncbi:MAG: hypothetical protein Q4G60_10755 [bacterium]|nr:hypothetical protein [bacterium]